ncbi:MAG: hypothetical protein JJU40_13195 [Rhodobacteraceae bacterium]|nr:hypothetical protein [Paracoccaceae bacterium]
MIGLVLGLLIAAAGLVAGAAAGRYLSSRWAPGILGGITGAFGIGALRVSGYGDAALLPLAGAMIVYGLLVGLVAMVAARHG